MKVRTSNQCMHVKSSDMVSHVDTHPDIRKQYTVNTFNCVLDFITKNCSPSLCKPESIPWEETLCWGTVD